MVSVCPSESLSLNASHSLAGGCHRLSKACLRRWHSASAIGARHSPGPVPPFVPCGRPSSSLHQPPPQPLLPFCSRSVTMVCQRTSLWYLVGTPPCLVRNVDKNMLNRIGASMYPCRMPCSFGLEPLSCLPVIQTYKNLVEMENGL